MSAAFSGRQLLLAASAASYALVFVAFLLYERPGRKVMRGYVRGQQPQRPRAVS